MKIKNEEIDSFAHELAARIHGEQPGELKLGLKGLKTVVEIWLLEKNLEK